DFDEQDAFADQIWRNNGDGTFSIDTPGSPSRVVSFIEDEEEDAENEAGTESLKCITNGFKSIDNLRYLLKTKQLKADFAEQDAFAEEVWRNNGDGTFTIESPGEPTRVVSIPEEETEEEAGNEAGTECGSNSASGNEGVFPTELQDIQASAMPWKDDEEILLFDDHPASLTPAEPDTITTPRSPRAHATVFHKYAQLRVPSRYRNHRDTVTSPVLEPGALSGD
ncbi:hypothetical protein PENTCL1PPCAC_5668, partial [Pristionchus entomophagus]